MFILILVMMLVRFALRDNFDVLVCLGVCLVGIVVVVR